MQEDAVSKNPDKKRSRIQSVDQTDEGHVAATAVVLLMATTAGCTENMWKERVVIDGGAPLSIEAAARSLASSAKPIQCDAQCGPNGLAVRCSAIIEPKFLMAHANQVAMLDRGEGVIGSILANRGEQRSVINLKASAEVLELSRAALEKVARDYLITMPLALSSKSEPGLSGDQPSWTIIAGQVRSVSQSEVERWLATREKLAPE